MTLGPLENLQVLKISALGLRSPGLGFGIRSLAFRDLGSDFMGVETV